MNWRHPNCLPLGCGRQSHDRGSLSRTCQGPDGRCQSHGEFDIPLLTSNARWHPLPGGATSRCAGQPEAIVIAEARLRR
jgi:hypothetical protein